MRSIGFKSGEQHGHTSSLQQCTGDGTHSVDFFNFNLTKSHAFHAFLITKLCFSLFSMTNESNIASQTLAQHPFLCPFKLIKLFF